MYLKTELYELMRSDERIFDFIQDGSLDGLWYWDLENPENEWMNARFWTVLGYNPEEMPHQSSAWQSIINPDDLKVASENFTKHCENPDHPYDQIVRYRHKDGSTKWIRCRGLAIRDHTGKPIRMLGAHQDISDVKNNEQALLQAMEIAKESEEKYRAMYNNAPLSYQSLDENGYFLDINPMWLRTLGYERDEVIGKWYGDFLHPDYVEHFRINFPAFKKRGYVSDVQFKLRRKDNTYIHVSFEGCIGYTPEGKVKQTYCVFKDITEQKAVENAFIKAKEQAERNEERFNLAMKASHDGLFDWNLETNGIYYSPGWKKMLGYEDHELPDDFSVWETLTDPEDVKKSWELQQKLVTGQVDRFVMEFKMKHKDGHWVDILSRAEAIFDGRGKAVRIVGTHTDISDRKQAEMALKNRENLLNKIFDVLPIGLWFADPEGKLIRGNPAGVKIWGAEPTVSIDEYGIFKARRLPSGKEIEPDDWALAHTIREGVTIGDEELEIDAFDGQKKIILNYTAPVHDDQGKIQGAIVVNQDITKSKHAELLLQEKSEEIAVQNEELNQTNQELIAAKEKAEESDRLKSAFLANMSHEIRTPMNGILGFADLLKEPGLSGEEQQAYIRIIEKSGLRMLNTINEIVDISRIEAGMVELSLKEMNINELMEEIFAFFKVEAEAKKLRISCLMALPAKEAIITSDREKVFAIVTNLVKNAIKFTSQGSIEMGYKIVVESTHALSLPQFYVKDTGIGIPEERQEAIFERFIQADISDRMAFQGAGLGLSIAKAYTEMLGGRIWVESMEGAGSTFYFTLPCGMVAQRQGNEIQPASAGEIAIGKKLKILVAEDEEDSEVLIDRYLHTFSRGILKAKTGIEAVNTCRENPDIDLVLMDIKMPGMNGYEATKMIRSFNKEVVIIAQTAYGLSGDREKSINSGCNDYIAKPVKKSELQSLIQKYFLADQ